MTNKDIFKKLAEVYEFCDRFNSLEVGAWKSSEAVREANKVAEEAYAEACECMCNEKAVEEYNALEEEYGKKYASGKVPIELWKILGKAYKEAYESCEKEFTAEEKSWDAHKKHLDSCRASEEAWEASKEAREALEETEKFCKEEKLFVAYSACKEAYDALGMARVSWKAAEKALNHANAVICSKGDLEKVKEWGVKNEQRKA
jgi:hypothetical protein